MGHQITGNSDISTVPSVIAVHLKKTNPPLPTISQEPRPPLPPPTQSTQTVTDNYSFDGFYQSSNGGLSNSNGTSQLGRQGRVYHTQNSQDRLIIMLFCFVKLNFMILSIFLFSLKYLK